MSVHHLDWNDPFPPPIQRGAVAVGNFDGVHLGHIALLKETAQLAKALPGPTVVVTFDPHPLQLLAPEHFQPPLTTIARRTELLLDHGADEVLILHTTAELLEFPPERFFLEIIQKKLQARAVVEGFNFRFGRDRAGDTEMLAGWCADADILFHVVPPQELDGQTVSSSKVRHALVAGDVQAASRWLGRAYRLCGRVGEGQRRGRTIGFPTANLINVTTLIPAEGVYAVRVDREDGGFGQSAVINIGPNPTFGEQERKLEVHLIDVSDVELYDRVLHVDFIARLRETRPFAHVDELVRQLHQDVAQAREILSVRE